MNVFKKLTNNIKAKKAISDSIFEWQKKHSSYLKLSIEQFSSLPEEELFEAAIARTEAVIGKESDITSGIDLLKDAAKTFYIASYYEMEVNNGGLCQFFVNSSREVAPLLSKCLQEIDANEHRKLFDDFISKHNIDLSDLTSFIIKDVTEFENQTKRYPFDDFDNDFCRLEPISDILTPYIRKHLSDF